MEYIFEKSDGIGSEPIIKVVALENNLIASGDKEGIIRVFDVTQGPILYKLDASNPENDHKSIIDLAYLNNGFLASTTAFSLKIWDLNKRELKYTIQRPKEFSSYPDFSQLLLLPNNLLAVSGWNIEVTSKRPVIEIYELNTAKKIFTISYENGGSAFLDTNMDYTDLVACGRNLVIKTTNDIQIWEIATTTTTTTIPLSTESTSAVTVSNTTTTISYSTDLIENAGQKSFQLSFWVFISIIPIYFYIEILNIMF